MSTNSLAIRSEAFQSGEPIPKKYSGEGENISPPLSWEGVPAQAKSLALIADDPDAPMDEPFVHWVIYGIDPQVGSLGEGIAASPRPAEPNGAAQGVNSAGGVGYTGPKPPPGHGVHHYHFKLYALDTRLELPPGATKAQVVEAMQGHVLAQGELVGTYERQ